VVREVHGISEEIAHTSYNLAAREGRYCFVQKIDENVLKATSVVLERAHLCTFNAEVRCEQQATQHIEDGAFKFFKYTFPGFNI